MSLGEHTSSALARKRASCLSGENRVTRTGTCRSDPIKPVGGHWAMVSDCGCRRQSANQALGCHGRRCFAKESVSDPDLTCCSLPSPHRSRGHPRHDCGSAVSFRLAKWTFKNRANCAEASSESLLYDGHWFNVSSAKNSALTPRVADSTNPTVRVGWPTPSQQWLTRTTAVSEMSRCVETVFCFGTVHAT